MLDELVGCRNYHRADFMERENGEPELIMAFKNEHYAVAAAYSEGLEIVCGHIGVSLHIGKSERVGFMVSAYPEHSGLVRRFYRESVHYVESEIEFFLVFETNALKNAVFVRFRFDKIVGNGAHFFADVRAFYRFAGEFVYVDILVFFGFYDYCVQRAVRSVESAERVREGTVVINRVAGVENLFAVVYLNLKSSADDDVYFLSVMFRKNGFFLGIGDVDPKRLGELVFERRR